MTDVELIEIIEVGQRIVFETAKNNADGKDLISRLIELEGERLKDAAAILGLEWNGMFHPSHVEVIIRAYNEANRRTVQRAGGGAS